MPDAPHTTPPLVVIVNDDVTQLELLAAIFQAEPVAIARFTHASDALRYMRERPPSVIITDLHMPGMDGWQFCRALRSLAYRSLNQVPLVIISSSLHGSQAPGIAEALGASDYFTPPLDPRLVRERVRALVANPGAPAPARILLAIANKTEADSLSSLLGRGGARTIHASTLATLTTLCTLEAWDALVIDLELPGFDFSRLETIAAAFPQTAIITLSDSREPQIQTSSLHSGATAHLRRPFTPEYLAGLCHLARQKNSLIRVQSLLDRRTAELHESQRLLEGILNVSDQIQLMLDAEGRLEICNDAGRRAFAEIIRASIRPGDRIFPAIPASLRSIARLGFARALRGVASKQDVDLTDISGRRRRFIASFCPLPARETGVARVCFNAYDITARAEAEDDLRLRDQALRSISQGVVIADSRRRILYVNDGYTAITGYTAGEALNRPSSLVQGAGTAPETKEFIRRNLETTHTFQGEILNYRRDGTPYWNELTINPVKDDTGRHTHYIGVLRDVSDRKREQDELARSRARLQALFDHSQEAIILADDLGRFLDANPAACRLLGYPPAEIVSLSIAAIFAADDPAWAENAWREFIAEGRQSGECMLRRRDGTVLRAEYNAIARIQPGLNLAILRDVTERHQLQAQLLRQQRLESVGRLASGVAHDLNNILTPILMAPAMIRRHLSDPAARLLLDTLESGARRGSAIVRQLMTFARADAGEKIPLDLGIVVRDVAALIHETFRKDITLEFAPIPGEVRFPLVGDAQQLRQAILNIALNAADSMPRGGRLVLTLEQVGLTRDEAALEPGAQSGPHAVVSVADHGSGILPEHLDKIFDPFFTTKPFGQGSGLGLSVVLGIARAHGGFVRVSSRVGIGTIVRLHIPLQIERADPGALVPGPASSAPKGRVVLVVDDESAVRDIIRLILVREGYDVICADGADAAFSQLQAAGGRIHLVLTDLAMPGVSGARLIERLNRHRPDLPILVLTGNDSRHALPDTLRSLVRGVIVKPCDAATLSLAVANAFTPPASE